MSKISGKHRSSIHIRLLNQTLQIPKRQLSLSRKRKTGNKPVNNRKQRSIQVLTLII